MSQALSSSASKKKQDERNSKLLREIAALPTNRFCFECDQRGPTYVNITHGSFCCSTCSGLLRGLNPPHRVKSISMATFSSEEIEKIRSLGNEENQKTWMGMFNGAQPKFSNRDDMQTFLIKKYEKKSWYVSRVELEQQEKLLNAAKEKASQGTTSLGSDSSSQKTSELFGNDPFGVDTFSISSSRGQSTDPFERIPVSQQPFSPPAQLAPAVPFFPPSGPPAHTLPPKAVCSSQQDPFSPVKSRPATVQLPVMTNNDPFSTFGNQFGHMSIKSSVSAQGISNSNAPAPSVVQRSTTMLNPGTIPPRPTAASVQIHNGMTQASSSYGQSTSNSDKYSALAELDQLFHSGSDPSSQNTTARSVSSEPWNAAPPVVAPQQYASGYAASTTAPSNTLNPFAVSPFPPTNTNGAAFQDPWNTPPQHQNSMQKSNTIGGMGEFAMQPAAPLQNAHLYGSAVQMNGSALPRDARHQNPFLVPSTNPFVAPIQNVNGQSINTPSSSKWNPFVS